jgi:hypothetical protein
VTLPPHERFVFIVVQFFQVLRREAPSGDGVRTIRRAGAGSYRVTGRQLRDRSGCVERQRQERLHRPAVVTEAIAKRATGNSRAATSAGYLHWIGLVEETYDTLEEYFVKPKIHAANRLLNGNGRQSALNECAHEFTEFIRRNRGEREHFRTPPVLQPVRRTSPSGSLFYPYRHASHCAMSCAGQDDDEADEILACFDVVPDSAANYRSILAVGAWLRLGGHFRGRYRFFRYSHRFLNCQFSVLFSLSLSFSLSPFSLSLSLSLSLSALCSN